jgi:LysM repeat protein
MDIMKNVKLTLATTLSVLALTFAGAASADNGKRYNNQKQQDKVSFNKKQSSNKKVTNKTFHAKNMAAKKVTVNKVTVKKATPKKVFVTKNVVKKPAKPQHVSKNRYNTKKVVKTNVYRNVNRKVNTHSYKVRSGDTLYRISLKTGVSVNKLAQLNRITNWNINNIRIGQILRLS